MTAAIRTTPPTSVAVAGVSEIVSQTQSGGEHDLEQSDQRHLRGRNQSGAEGQEGKPEAHLPDSEDDHEEQMGSIRSSRARRTAPRRQ